tara:strand:- start:2863 stop:3768 length:906 start_codon:yes stop_codon:yes gene_type:complete
MKKFKSHFKFNKQERSGIFFLLLIIVVLQITYFLFTSLTSGNVSLQNFHENQGLQSQIEVLKQSAFKKDTFKIYSFNPNFITDYKGYTLGMSLEEINRLHDYRATNAYVNSNQEFQEITLISDSLLQLISPYFKYPEWVKNKRSNFSSGTDAKSRYLSKTEIKKLKQTKEVRDLNLVTAIDLKSIYGIGDKLAARIIKFRDKLGGFLVVDQLNDVYGLELEVADRVKEKFRVLTTPQVVKININESSALEISKLVYLNYTVSKNIVRYREENNGIQSFDELIKIEDFPSEKINRISLYLAL